MLIIFISKHLAPGSRYANTGYVFGRSAKKIVLVHFSQIHLACLWATHHIKQTLLTFVIDNIMGNMTK